MVENSKSTHTVQRSDLEAGVEKET